MRPRGPQGDLEKPLERPGDSPRVRGSANVRRGEARRGETPRPATPLCDSENRRVPGAGGSEDRPRRLRPPALARRSAIRSRLTERAPALPDPPNVMCGRPTQPWQEAPGTGLRGGRHEGHVGALCSGSSGGHAGGARRARWAPGMEPGRPSAKTRTPASPAMRLRNAEGGGRGGVRAPGRARGRLERRRPSARTGGGAAEAESRDRPEERARGDWTEVWPRPRAPRGKTRGDWASGWPRPLGEGTARRKRERAAVARRKTSRGSLVRRPTGLRGTRTRFLNGFTSTGTSHTLGFSRAAASVARPRSRA